METQVRWYRTWLLTTAEGARIVEAARRELRGRVLGCWCAPYRCHGETLSAVAACCEATLAGWRAEEATEATLLLPGERYQFDVASSARRRERRAEENPHA